MEVLRGSGASGKRKPRGKASHWALKADKVFLTLL